MASNRRSPTTANYGATIPDNTYADDVDVEFSALWALAPETLGSVSGINTITAALTPALLAYGIKLYLLTPASANTGPVTLNIDSLGAKNVKTQAGAALSGGELPAGYPTLIYYTGSEFRLVFTAPNQAIAVMPLNYLSGFGLSNNGTDATNDIDIAVGAARDSTNAVNLIGSAQTKQLDAAWVAGTNQGAILQSANLTGTITVTTNTAVAGTSTVFVTDFSVGDVIQTVGGQARRITAIASNTAMTVESAWSSGETGVTYKRGGRAKSTKYGLYALYKDADLTVDYAISPRAETPVDLPSGYTKFRRLGWVLTDSSNVIRPFIQDGDNFTLKTLVTEASPSWSSASSTTLTSTAPPDTRALFEVAVSWISAGSGSSPTGSIALREVAGVAGQERVSVNAGGSEATGADSNAQVLLDSSAQFVYAVSAGNSGGTNSTYSGTIKLWGWIDRRGRD